MHHLFMSLTLTFWKQGTRQAAAAATTFFLLPRQDDIVIFFLLLLLSEKMIIITFIFRVYVLEFNDLLKNHRSLSLNLKKFFSLKMKI